MRAQGNLKPISRCESTRFVSSQPFGPFIAEKSTQPSGPMSAWAESISPSPFESMPIQRVLSAGMSTFQRSILPSPSESWGFVFFDQSTDAGFMWAPASERSRLSSSASGSPDLGVRSTAWIRSPSLSATFCSDSMALFTAFASIFAEADWKPS